MAPRLIPVRLLRTDGGTNVRQELHPDAVEDYAVIYRAGGKLPPLVAYKETGQKGFWLAEGFHRVAAARKAGVKSLPVRLRRGTARDALLHAAGTNETHGVRRTPKDKRRAVELVLLDPEWEAMSDKWVAEKCRVGDHLVASVRKSMAATAPTRTSPAKAKRVGRDGKLRPASTRRVRGEKGGRVVYDWGKLSLHFGYVVRFPDDLARAYDDKGAEEYAEAKRLTGELADVMKAWRNRLVHEAAVKAKAKAGKTEKAAP